MPRLPSQNSLPGVSLPHASALGLGWGWDQGLKVVLLVESAFFQCSPSSLDPQLRDWYTVSTQIFREEIFLLCSILCFQNEFSRPLPLNRMASSSGPLGGPGSADAGGSPGGSAWGS